MIGTGATGVQTIQTIAGSVGHLTVFQRTPNWCAPLHNGKIDAETQKKIKAGYPGDVQALPGDLRLLHAYAGPARDFRGIG